MTTYTAIRYFLFLLLINFSADFLHSQWTVISNQGNQAVSFPSENIGYSTANGITKKTTNGGYNWTSLSGGNLTGIFFLNDLTGWVVGYPGYIGKTINGTSFVQQQTGISDRLNDVFFINENTGWVVGGDFGTERIFNTTNGGTNWIVQSSGTSNKLFSVYFINENTGWSVGGPSSPKIIKTTNGGTNWFTQSAGISTPLYSVMFADANTGWAVAGYIGGETIIKTINGGNVWFSQSSGDNRYLRECYVKDSMTAFAVGEGGKLISTTNGGINWNVNSTGSTVELWSIDFTNDSVGFAIGSTVVLKTTSGGITWITSKNTNVPETFKLYQNYPNPFNPITKIRFVITNSNVEKANIQIDIFNSLGQLVTTLINYKFDLGTYEVEFDGFNFSSGIYYYSLIEDGDLVDTKKMVLIK